MQNSSPILRWKFLARKGAKFIANFSATKVTSLPSLSLSLSLSLYFSLFLSLSLSLSPSAPHTHYRKRFRASYIVCDVHASTVLGATCPPKVTFELMHASWICECVNGRPAELDDARLLFSFFFLFWELFAHTITAAFSNRRKAERRCWHVGQRFR